MFEEIIVTAEKKQSQDLSQAVTVLVALIWTMTDLHICRSQAIAPGVNVAKNEGQDRNSSEALL